MVYWRKLFLIIKPLDISFNNTNTGYTTKAHLKFVKQEK